MSSKRKGTSDGVVETGMIFQGTTHSASRQAALQVISIRMSIRPCLNGNDLHDYYSALYVPQCPAAQIRAQRSNPMTNILIRYCKPAAGYEQDTQQTLLVDGFTGLHAIIHHSPTSRFD